MSMLITKQQTKEKRPDASTTIWEYDLPTKNIGIATAKINGRHPEAGWIKNTGCELAYYCISGQGKITIEGEQSDLQTGDVLFNEKNKKYFIEGQDLLICLPSAPAWTAEQLEAED